jgi:hypothetical protein
VPNLERCPTCAAWFDPASLDEAIYHGFARCADPNGEKPNTGIRGELVDESPQS